ncbi:hypothetical protein SMD44_08370 [Streptomyces alboflavus]|uniref:Uncharacterized protein n=1 Tax=Streptomyces alboflavus TaxID=67267 RepID=A0A1Z1WR09_9ACTN|nr:hypothetical protein SMD44_08370 [Streptomyces alboflavus]
MVVLGSTRVESSVQPSPWRQSVVVAEVASAREGAVGGTAATSTPASSAADSLAAFGRDTREYVIVLRHGEVRVHGP